MLWNYIEEFENPHLPLQLRQLLGDEVSVAVLFNEKGVAKSCGGQIAVRRKSYEKAIKISQHLEDGLQAALCPSIMTWKFRPMIYCSKPVPAYGPSFSESVTRNSCL